MSLSSICEKDEGQRRLALFSVLFFKLTQFVAKLNVLAREMSHQQPEVQKFFFHFSFYSTSVFTIDNAGGF